MRITIQGIKPDELESLIETACIEGVFMKLGDKEININSLLGRVLINEYPILRDKINIGDTEIISMMQS